MTQASKTRRKIRKERVVQDAKANDDPDEVSPATMGKLALEPVLRHAHTILAFTHGLAGRRPTQTGLFSGIAEQLARAKAGTLSDLEGRLAAQAVTLDVMFTNLAMRAGQSDRLDLMESFMRLALKAQSQSRATIETLANIKNPSPVAFVRQANIGQAVQVNNGASRAREIQSEQNEQSGVCHVVHQNTGAPTPARATDPALETMAKVHRSENAGRQAKIES